MASPTSRQILVSGLRRGQIEYYTTDTDLYTVTGIKQEDDLGAFFQDQGFDVEVVALEVTEDYSKGFGYVTFESLDDVKKAVGHCHGKPAPRLTGRKDALLKVEPVQQATVEKLSIAKHLKKVQDANADLDRELQAIQARIEIDKQETERLQKRQAELQSAADEIKLQEEIAAKEAKEKKREELIAEEAKVAAQRRHAEERVKKSQTLEDHRINIAADQLRPHVDEATKAFKDDIDQGRFRLNEDQLWILGQGLEHKPPKPPLVRSTTAPPIMHRKADLPCSISSVRMNIAPISPESDDWEAPVPCDVPATVPEDSITLDMKGTSTDSVTKEEQRSCQAAGYSKPIEYADGNFWDGIREALGRNEMAEDVIKTCTGLTMTMDQMSNYAGDQLCAFFPISVNIQAFCTKAIIRACDVCKLPLSGYQSEWSTWDCSKCGKIWKQEDLVYACQNQNVCRSYHEWGICETCSQVIDNQDKEEKGKEIVANDDESEAKATPETEPNKETALEAKAAPKASTPVISLGQAQRRVRLKKVPSFNKMHLQSVIQPELTRLWRVARSRPTPEVELAETVQVDTSGTAAKENPTLFNFMEVILQFKYQEDAVWLVEERDTRWSTGCNLTLKGVIVEVEWAEPRARTDLRKLSAKAPSDKASLCSWGTKGTGVSNSTVINNKVKGDNGVQGPRAKQAPIPPTADRNCTIVLEGIPQDMPPHQVKQEVLLLLKRLWQTDGMDFDDTKLRGGFAEGIVVKGNLKQTCIVKFRWPGDARWMIWDGNKRVMRLAGGETKQLQAKWAFPK